MLHILIAVFTPHAKGLNSRDLSLTGSAKNAVLMNLVHDGNHFRWAANVAHAPARHSEGLAEAVDGQRIVPHAGQRGEAHMLTAVGQLGIDLVADHHDLMLADDLRQRFQIGAGHNSAGGVVRVRKDQRLGAGRDGRTHLLGGKTEVRILPRFHAHGSSARENHAGAVADIAGFRHQHLVAGGKHGPQGYVNGFAGAHGDDHLRVRVVRRVIAPLQITADLLTQRQQTAIGRILRLAVHNAVNGGIADVIRRNEVRLAHAEGNRVLHGGGQIKETANAAGGYGDHPRVQKAIIVHGVTTSR